MGCGRFAGRGTGGIVAVNWSAETGGFATPIGLAFFGVRRLCAKYVMMRKMWIHA